MIFRYLLVIVVVIFSHTSVMANQLGQVIYQGKWPGAYSLPSLMLATLQHPNTIELPLLLSKDNIPVVYNDFFLQNQTNVADVFPGRNRQDGNYYVIDFTLAEISQLSYRQTGSSLVTTSHPTSFEDALQAIAAIARHVKKPPKILAVVKYPWFHANEKKESSAIIIDTFISHRETVVAPLYLKCYDPEELQRIKKNILPDLPVEFQLIQGIDRAGGQETMRQKRGSWFSYNYDWLFTRLGLRVLSEYADGLMLKDTETANTKTLSRLITDSHSLSMKVYVEIASPQLTSASKLFEELIYTQGVDGLALSQPELLLDFLRKRQQQGQEKSEIRPETSFDPEALSRRLKTLK